MAALAALTGAASSVPWAVAFRTPTLRSWKQLSTIAASTARQLDVFNAPAFSTVFRFPFLGGHVVGVKLPPPALDSGGREATSILSTTVTAFNELHSEELAFCQSLVSPGAASSAPRAEAPRLNEAARFAGGRLALRRALSAHLGSATAAAAAGPALRGARGGPSLPAALGVSVSISHKDVVAAALVAPDHWGPEGFPRAVGVDVENLAVPRSYGGLRRRILTEGEQSLLGGLGGPSGAGLSVDEEVLLAFSLKVCP